MAIPRPTTNSSVDKDETKRYVFVLLKNFTLLSFSSALESLRIANRMAGRDIYSWRIIGEGGQVAYCSAGTGFQLNGDLDDVARNDVVRYAVASMSKTLQQSGC